MARLSLVTALSIAILLNCGLGAEGKSVQKRDFIQLDEVNDLYSYICSNPMLAQLFSMCTTTPATPVVSDSTTPVMGSTTVSEILGLASTTSVVGPSEPSDGTTTVVSPSASTTKKVSPDTTSATNLQLAHWCQFNNGSYIPLGYTFMYTACAICQCTQSHSILCANLQCMPTYCIDGSAPVARPGQCCAQCAYEQPATTCSDNGVTLPQGILIRSTPDGVQCWCQQGGIECRQTSSPSDSSSSTMGDYSTSYVIIIVLCIFVILGSILCCGGVLVYYYYYQQNQQAAQVAYDQYWNSAGWQPMGEGDLGVDPSADQKQAEAEQEQVEQGYPVGTGQEFIPPPYALYNGTYVVEAAPQKTA